MTRDKRADEKMLKRGITSEELPEIRKTLEYQLLCVSFAFDDIAIAFFDLADHARHEIRKVIRENLKV